MKDTNQLKLRNICMYVSTYVLKHNKTMTKTQKKIIIITYRFSQA